MKLANNHITLASTQDMKELGSPLKMIHVDFFSYTRFYMDGTSISLLTHTDWYEFFLKEEVPECVNVFKLKTGCNLWAELFPEKAVADAKNRFNIDNGIHFAYRENDYVETISYASKATDLKAMGYFMANMDLLERFIPYFRKRASPLINNAVKSKIIIPEVMRGYQEFESGFVLNSEDRKKFLEQIGYNADFKKLTPREYECLEHTAHGMTVKEVASFLNISRRTIEGYLENARLKLRCNSKSQLAEIYWSCR